MERLAIRTLAGWLAAVAALVAGGGTAVQIYGHEVWASWATSNTIAPEFSGAWSAEIVSPPDAGALVMSGTRLQGSFGAVDADMARLAQLEDTGLIARHTWNLHTLRRGDNTVDGGPDWVVLHAWFDADDTVAPLLRRGRLPAGADELVLSYRSAVELDAWLGDEVVASDFEGASRTLRVVGITGDAAHWNFARSFYLYGQSPAVPPAFVAWDSAPTLAETWGTPVTSVYWSRQAHDDLRDELGLLADVAQSHSPQNWRPRGTPMLGGEFTLLLAFTGAGGLALLALAVKARRRAVRVAMRTPLKRVAALGAIGSAVGVVLAFLVAAAARELVLLTRPAAIVPPTAPETGWGVAISAGAAWGIVVVVAWIINTDRFDAPAGRRGATRPVTSRLGWLAARPTVWIPMSLVLTVGALTRLAYRNTDFGWSDQGPVGPPWHFGPERWLLTATVAVCFAAIGWWAYHRIRSRQPTLPRLSAVLGVIGGGVGISIFAAVQIPDSYVDQAWTPAWGYLPNVYYWGFGSAILRTGIPVGVAIALAVLLDRMVAAHPSRGTSDIAAALNQASPPRWRDFDRHATAAFVGISASSLGVIVAWALEAYASYGPAYRSTDVTLGGAFNAVVVALWMSGTAAMLAVATACLTSFLIIAVGVFARGASPSLDAEGNSPRLTA